MDWNDLRSKLQQINKSSVSNYSPSNFSIVEFKDFYRIYFLGNTGSQGSNTLLYSDINKKNVLNETFKGQQSVLLNIQPCLSPNSGAIKNQPLTRDQELLRERMRVKTSGITSYNLTNHLSSNNKNSTQVVFTSGNQLNIFKDDSAVNNLSSLNLHGNIIHPQTCPDDRDVLAYVQDGDLYVTIVSTSSEVRLTHLRRDISSWLENSKSAGIPSYIVQEEFDRFVGYWWRPQDPRAAIRTVRRYKILYEEIDESSVDVLNIVSHSNLGSSVDQYRYPRPGTRNATSDLKIIEFVRKGDAIEEIRELSLVKPLFLLFPDMEYLLDAGWLPDGKRIYAVMMNRKQNIKRTYLIPTKNFRHNRDNTNNSKILLPGFGKTSNEELDKFYLIMEEKSPDMWLHANKLLRFVRTDKSTIFRRKSNNNNNEEDDGNANEEKGDDGVNDRAGNTASDTDGVIILEDEDEIVVGSRSGDDDDGREDFYDCYDGDNDDDDGDDDDDDFEMNVCDENVDNDNDVGYVKSVKTSSSINIDKSNSATKNDNDNNAIKNCAIVSFICGMETSGYLHLHHVTVDLKDCISSATNPQQQQQQLLNRRNFATTSLYTPSSAQPYLPTISSYPYVYVPNVLRNVKLTSGEWEVDAKKVWVDETNKILYFVGYKDTPLESHLYLMTFDSKLNNKPMEPRRISKAGFSHNITMDEKLRIFITTMSSLRVPNTCEVYSILISPSSTESGLAKVKFVYSGSLHVPDIAQLSPEPPIKFDFLSSTKVRLYGLLIKPNMAAVLPPQKLARGRHKFSPNTTPMADHLRGVQVQKYPVVLYVYGGPHAQLVSNSYTGQKFTFQNKLAQFGYAVVVIDNRGSAHRGYAFEGYLKNKMGNIEIADQIEGLYHIGKTYDFLDLDRVAIMGWSYGGYLALMGLVQRPDIFKVAISGAPVTSWMLYDTGYTERYMGLPKDNEQAYKDSSVIEKADQFPNQEGRLLIVHGLMDENVHFYHTSALVSELVKNHKPYVLQTYPNERHGIRNAQSHEHYECLLMSFLINNL